jgi:hypothetical protein
MRRKFWETVVVAVRVQMRDSYLITVEADDRGVTVGLCLAKNCTAPVNNGSARRAYTRKDLSDRFIGGK